MNPPRSRTTPDNWDTTADSQVLGLMRAGKYNDLISEIENRGGWSHLSSNQRALIAAEIYLRLQFTPRAVTRGQLRHWFGLSFGTQQRALLLLKYGTPELSDLVFADDRVGLSTVERVMKLPPDGQADFLAKVKAGVEPRLAGSSNPRKRQQHSYTHAGARQLAARRREARQARYRHVPESALTVLGHSFDGLAAVLASSEGLDPAVTPEQAALWRQDLSRRAKAFRVLLALLKERSNEHGHSHPTR